MSCYTPFFVLKPSAHYTVELQVDTPRMSDFTNRSTGLSISDWTIGSLLKAVLVDQILGRVAKVGWCRRTKQAAASERRVTWSF